MVVGSVGLFYSILFSRQDSFLIFEKGEEGDSTPIYQALSRYLTCMYSSHRYLPLCMILIRSSTTSFPIPLSLPPILLPTYLFSFYSLLPPIPLSLSSISEQPNEYTTSTSTSASPRRLFYLFLFLSLSISSETKRNKTSTRFRSPPTYLSLT